MDLEELIEDEDKVEGIYKSGFEAYQNYEFENAYQAFMLLNLIRPFETKYKESLAKTCIYLEKYDEALVLFIDLKSSNYFSLDDLNLYKAKIAFLKNEPEKSQEIFQIIKQENIKNQNLEQFDLLKEELEEFNKF